MPSDARTLPARIRRTSSTNEHGKAHPGENGHRYHDEFHDFPYSVGAGIPPRCVFETRGRYCNLRPHPRLRFMGVTTLDSCIIPSMHGQQDSFHDEAQNAPPFRNQDIHCSSALVSKHTHKFLPQESRQNKHQAQALHTPFSIPKQDRSSAVFSSDGNEIIKDNAGSSNNSLCKKSNNPSTDAGVLRANSKTQNRKPDDPMLFAIVSTESQVSSCEGNALSRTARDRFPTKIFRLPPTVRQKDQDSDLHSKMAGQLKYPKRTTFDSNTTPKAFHLPTGSIDLIGMKGVRS